ncbi:EamA family transporter RarD [Kangiella sp. HZ709]|uniref:EamA family transporter RarD n=1 Tax=Kangiella sp. HZ709 TaxID=2666328 RepID=UPI0014165A3B|nr:EamA family transporter RarD [Kangiella sp. HZ709]
MSQQNSDLKAGYLYAILAFLIWGLAPIYFKALGDTSALEILAHRIAWSVPVIIIIMLAIKRPFPKSIWQDKKTLITLFITATLISSNWLIFTWAVVNDRVLDTSLGYFINPLLTVALGILVLREKLDGWKIAALILASLGVAYRIVILGGVPWISLSLATTFAIYGLLRKQVNIGPLQGLLVETLIVLPVTAGYIFYLLWNGFGAFMQGNLTLDWLLIAGGVITTVPLALFAAGARILPLNTIGFIQYLAPTLTFFLAVFAFNEPFNQDLLISFSFIWLGLVVYSFGNFKQSKRLTR